MSIYEDTATFVKTDFNNVKEGQIFYLVCENPCFNGVMCVRIASSMATWGDDHSEKVNYFDIDNRKFGFAHGLEKVQIANKAMQNTIIKSFGIEH